MGTRRASSRVEAAVVLAVLGVLAILLAARCDAPREESAGRRCRNMLNQLAKGMATYVAEFGDNRFYPCPIGRTPTRYDYNGAEWLASLYWTSVVPDPDVFICPSSPDTNHDGADLGAERESETFGSQTVSYAAMHYRSYQDESGRPRPLVNDPLLRPVVEEPEDPPRKPRPLTAAAVRGICVPDSEPMACDDTQGTINHGTRTNGGMSVLFFDSHVEFKTSEEIDVERAVGQEDGLLKRLRN